MAKAKSTAATLGTLLQKLSAERKAHLAAIEVIDATLTKFGITPAAIGKVKAKPAPKKKAVQKPRRRKPKKFTTTANESILSHVKAAGEGGVTTEVLRKHWESEGRRGTVYNALRLLVKEGKLKRRTIKGGRGSIYLLS